MKKIGFVTCDPNILKNYFPTQAEPNFTQEDPFFTPDDQIAVNKLRQQGNQVKPVVWGYPLDSLQEFDLLVVRSPWDYMDNIDNKNDFMRWLNQLEQSRTPISNPIKLMQWLLDKHYLHDLKENGINVIPTTYLEKHSTLNLSTVFQQMGEFILKPCISAAGVGLFHIKTAHDAKQLQHQVAACLELNAYMLQDFIPEITVNGEWSLIFLGGEYSHCVHKQPAPNSILVHAERGGSLSFSKQPSKDLIDFARDAYAKILSSFAPLTNHTFNPKLITYLRLDIIETKSGYVLIECEGVEPELFFRAKSDSVTTFCTAIHSVITN